ncbi:MAG: dephospho-CoA kinase [Chloroflexi bacterium]|nr:dephospho-CoA kinase [Chloroflexota bacterium]
MGGSDRVKRVIGLTGNIAVGKSLALAMLAELGAATIDADAVAHQVLRKGGAAYAPVVEAFGSGILGADGEIERSALGAIVFADEAALRRLEAISHPAVRREIRRMVMEAEADVVVIEAIKLLEGELKEQVDAVWVVNASEARRLERLMEARGMSRAEAARRIALQNSQAEKVRRADVVIENEGDIEALRAQVAQEWDRFTTEGTED